jgi:hypothetical protein
MGSVPAPDVILKDAPAAPASGPDASNSDSVVPKLEDHHIIYDSPSDSGDDLQASASTEPNADKAQDPPAPAKRKGGRKPVSVVECSIHDCH